MRLKKTPKPPPAAAAEAPNDENDQAAGGGGGCLSGDNCNVFALVRRLLNFLMVFGLGMATQHMWQAGTVEVAVNAATTTFIKKASNTSKTGTTGAPATMSSTAEKDGNPAPEEETSQPTETATVKPSTTTTSSQTEPASAAPKIQQSLPKESERSVLEYWACCGLGHRLGRTAVAYHAAHHKRLGFQFKVNWGKCGTRDTFSTLFRDETEQELASYVNASRLHEHYWIGNEVPGYCGSGPSNCNQEVLDAHYQLFEELQRRYNGMEEIEQFIQRHFFSSLGGEDSDDNDNHQHRRRLAIGIHVRDGNGEKGEFQNTKREIANPEEFVQKATRHILQLLEQQQQHASNNNSSRELQPVLFVASDNPKYTGLFRDALNGQQQQQQQQQQVPVVEWSQHRQAGAGIFVGSSEEGVDENTCFAKWRDQLGDMILLSKVDIMIAARRSSYTQAMPLHMVLGRNSRNVATTTTNDNNNKYIKVARPYCEMHDNGDALTCHADSMDWCRNAKHFNLLKTMCPTGFQQVLDEMYKSPTYHNQSSPAT